jgi:hypothetical protein
MSYPILDPVTGDITVRDFQCEVDGEDLPFMEMWNDAHRLLPPPDSFLFDPDQYRDQLTDALRTVQIYSEEVDDETLLQAIAVIGHTPCQESLKALADFGRSANRFAPVARLALGECSGLYNIFRQSPVAC